MIPLSQWAKNNKIKRMDALNMAKRHKLKTAVLIPLAPRWMIDQEEKPPSYAHNHV